MIDRPKNSKTLLILIAVLLLSNLVGLILFLTNKPGRERMSGASERKNAMISYLKKDIGFSEAQLLAYDSLSARHRRNISPMFDLMKKEKENRLRYVAQYGFADTAITTAVGVTAAQQQVLETQMIMHLKDLRNICTDEQKIKFDSSIYKIFGRKGGGDKKK